MIFDTSFVQIPVQVSFFKKSILYAALFTGLLCLVIHRHSYNPDFTWRSDLWADPAGYYVYLPALFIYDFNAEKMAAPLDSMCGDGFNIDTLNNKIFTKYTCGVAMMQAPFFLGVHVFARQQEYFYKGFSGWYQMVPNIASAFYCFLGMVFLFHFLCFYYSRKIAALATAILFLGTNLYYFTVYSNGGSHVYSFSLFSIFLYLTKVILDKKEYKLPLLFFWSLVASMIVLIRPLNLLFILPAVFIDCNSLIAVRERILFFLKPKLLLVFAITMLLTFFPQMLYWKYLSGNWIFYSYENETFSYWKSPQLSKILFSPENGLLPYNPVYFIVIAAMIGMCFKKAANGLSILLTFCILTYLTSSWHSVTFGCGFGCRNFSEYAALSVVPVAWLINRIKVYRFTKYLVAFLLLICILVNQKAAFSYDRCFWGTVWDYEEYFTELSRGYYVKKFKVKNNGKFNRETKFSEVFTIRQAPFTLSSFRKARITSSAKLYNLQTKAAVVFSVKNAKDSTISWQAVQLRDYITGLNVLHEVTIDFPLLRKFDRNSVFECYIWNITEDSLEVKSINVELQ